jgi:hypothetical protein
MFKKINLLIAIVILGVLLIMPANAHTPILYIEDYRDGTIYLESGYSDGSSASGVEILLVEAKAFEGETTIRDKYHQVVFGNEYFKNLRDDYLRAIVKEGKETVYSEIYNLIKIEGNEVIFNEETNEVDFSIIEPELYKEKHLIVFRSALDEYSSLNLPKPEGDYLVVFNAGPGHTVEKEGPILTEEEKELLSE